MSVKFKKPTLEDAKMYVDPAWIHYTASLFPPRPGFALFSAILEYEFFPPDTEENDNFIILSTGWLHDSIWMTVSIPTKKKHLAEAVAKYCSLEILDTFPIGCVDVAAFATVRQENFEALSLGKVEWKAFPLYDCVNFFSLENTDDHPTRTKKMNHKEWFEHETTLVNEVIGDQEWTEDDKRSMEEFRRYMKTGK